jgi:hypothetical protein
LSNKANNISRNYSFLYFKISKTSELINLNYLNIKIMRNIMRKTITLLIILTANITYSQVPNYVPTIGLVGWWPFNGNANDASGNGNNGTVNGATLTTDRIGNANSAYSWSFWFKSPVSNYNGSFLSNYTWFIKLGHAGIPGVFYKDEIGNQNNTTYIQNYFNVFPQANIWHQVILQKVSNNITIFLDGINIGSITSYGSFNFGQSYLTKIGNIYNDYYNGQIDDIGIWNRALTQTEITALYTGTLSSESFTNTSSFQFYPNPTNDVMQFKSTEMVEKISIYNTLGQLVQENKTNSMEGAISIEHLAQGSYFVKVNNQNTSYTLLKK